MLLKFPILGAIGSLKSLPADILGSIRKRSLVVGKRKTKESTSNNNKNTDFSIFVGDNNGISAF